MPIGIEDYPRDLLLLVQGEPEEGKTTVVMQLLDGVCELNGQPWELRVVDLDRNLLPGVFKWGSKELKDAEALRRLWYINVDEALKLSQHGFVKVDGTARGWPQLMDLQTRWKEGKGVEAIVDEPYSSWPPNRVVVIDGLTLMGDLAYLHEKASAAGGFRTPGGELKSWMPADFGVVQQLMYDYCLGWKYMSGRQFPVVITCHMASLSINLSKQVTDDEIEAAQSSKIAKQELLKKASDIGNAMNSVQTIRMFPVIPGNKLSRQFKRLFYSVWVERQAVTGRPMVHTVPTERYSCRVPPGLAATLNGEDGISRVLNSIQQIGRGASAPRQPGGGATAPGGEAADAAPTGD